MTYLFLVLFTLGSIVRFLPHPANFAPIAAIGIFAGLYGNKKQAIFLPLAARIISDALIGFDTPAMMMAIYTATLLGSFLGIWAKNHKNVIGIATATLAGSISFFVITNLAVWAFTPLYVKNIMGLQQDFIAALPFFKNTLLGDIFYVIILITSFESVKYLISLKNRTKESKRICLSNS
jgi:hypothetical protein